MNKPLYRRNRSPQRNSIPKKRRKTYGNYHRSIKGFRIYSRNLFPIIASFVVLVGVGFAIAALFGAFSKSGLVIPPSSPVAQPAVAQPLSSGSPKNLVSLAQKAPLINFENPNLQDTPANLVDITDVVGDLAKINDMVDKIDAETGGALKALLEAANANGLTTLIINSTYREKSLQKEYFDARVAEDATYAQDPHTTPVKVLPDYASEHCAGLAVDITCNEVIGGSALFATTTEGLWLANNSHKYGFILRYPESKQNVTGVIYEPWHFRYVGVELATAIYESGLCMEEFYANLGL